MKFKLGKTTLFGVALAAFLCLGVTARASSIYGTVWANATSYPSNLPTTPPVGPASATFSISNPTGEIFNFFSGDDSDLTGFLTNGGSNGNTVTYLTGGNQNSIAEGCTMSRPASCGINNDIMEFKGTTYLAAGTYSVTKDDAAYLTLNGVPVLSALNDTGAETIWFTLGSSGDYSFDLLYSEVNGAPAVLNSDMVITPEPTSLLLLGTGLLGLALFVFRR